MERQRERPHWLLGKDCWLVRMESSGKRGENPCNGIILGPHAQGFHDPKKVQSISSFIHNIEPQFTIVLKMTFVIESFGNFQNLHNLNLSPLLQDFNDTFL